MHASFLEKCKCCGLKMVRVHNSKQTFETSSVFVKTTSLHDQTFGNDLNDQICWQWKEHTFVSKNMTVLNVARKKMVINLEFKKIIANKKDRQALFLL